MNFNVMKTLITYLKTEVENKISVEENKIIIYFEDGKSSTIFIANA